MTGGRFLAMSSLKSLKWSTRSKALLASRKLLHVDTGPTMHVTRDCVLDQTSAEGGRHVLLKAKLQATCTEEFGILYNKIHHSNTLLRVGARAIG